jgi:NAD(P)-dependent dehydrogenase (short-subunit alcohol dehydrogenase family)
MAAIAAEALIDPLVEWGVDTVFGLRAGLWTGSDFRRHHVVVVTGASAGIGRASAIAFAQKGARVAILARGDAGLEGAKDEIRRFGGEAIAIPTDVANFAEVDAAASHIEQEFGEIDIWVNDAFASVFAPFDQISPEEFLRVTEVSYLGFVHGTMAALSRMKPRNRGTIVQVGSALGERAIPLQSAYCGAKHAINGFTESLRCELMHDKSKVKITIVQMPAVNTPQFSWVLSRLPHHPQPVPPIYEPELAARGVVFASAHPKRKQYWVGGTTTATLVAQKFIPALLDRYLARTGYRSQQTNRAPTPTANNLWKPLDGRDGWDHGVRGIFGACSHQRSFELWFSQHLKRAVTWGLPSGAFLVLARHRRRPSQ